MIYVPHYTPYISSSKTNTTIQTKEFTEEIHIAGTFIIIFCVILIVLSAYMIKDIIKYFK